MNRLFSKRPIPRLVLLTAALTLVEPVLGMPAKGSPAGTIVASKRTKDMVITITADGRLTAGENSVCVNFQKRGTVEPVAITNVTVDFRLLVGRIEEQPIRSALVEGEKGEYCGRVDLGKLYYDPSSYYVFVHFTDDRGKKRTQRLFVSAISRPRK
jgi:hypothetical protein